MNPSEKAALLHCLDMLKRFVEKHPVGKSCISCSYYKDKACRMFDSVPPDHIVKVGCESWEWSGVPF